MQAEIAQLDELMKLGAYNRYFVALQRLIDKLKYALKEDPRDADPGIRPPIGPDPSPEGELLVTYQGVIERAVLSGDPDGSPMEAVIGFKNELAAFHLAEAARLQNEAKALGALAG